MMELLLRLVREVLPEELLFRLVRKVLPEERAFEGRPRYCGEVAI